MSLNTSPTRSEREMYDSCAPDYLWCTDCGEREDECRCTIETKEEDKMKFTVEVEDFYLDEEGDLAPGLTKFVTHEVVTQIWSKIQGIVEKKITEAVQSQTEAILSAQINMLTSQLISAGKITKNGKELLISDYIKDRFDNSGNWNAPYEQIEKLAKAYGNDMKKRYDYFYANQIVQQMHVIGVLKEEVFNKLIEQEKK